MIGLDLLGASAQPSATVGWLVEDYNWGESQVLQCVQYFDKVGKPPEFAARVSALQKSYDDTKSVWFFRGLVNASAMKDLGKQAQALMSTLQTFAQAKARAEGKPIPQGVDLSTSPAPPDEAGPLDSLNTFLRVLPWAAGGVLLIGGAIYAAPHVATLIALRKRGRLHA